MTDGPHGAATGLDGYSVAVRTLCEFTAKRGDIDIGFKPSTNAREGILGHQIVGARRGSNYEREVALQGCFSGLLVRGRADGYDAAFNKLEEFKTHRGPVTLIPSNRHHLHWAQLKAYGALACRQKQLDHVILALVYFDVRSERETVYESRFSADTLLREFEEQCARFLSWARLETRHRIRRNQYLEGVAFPFGEMRASQRQFAESVYKAVHGARTLMAEAPTGVGKTLGTLFPTLKAVPKQHLDKVFFLTAKTSGRLASVQAMRTLLGEDSLAPLRVIEYASKKDMCVHPGLACCAASCPLAKGFYDRLAGARDIAVEGRLLDQNTIREIARGFDLCPYYLTQELVRWCDVIIADYNYYFDTSAHLYALATNNQWRIALLVDESHNLLPRARSMYSASLHPDKLRAAARTAPAAVIEALDALRCAWRDSCPSVAVSYLALGVPSSELLASLDAAAGALLDCVTMSPDTAGTDTLEFLFEILRFRHLADSFGVHSLFDATPVHAGGLGCLASLSIRNVIPATFLAARLAASTATILFSATLSPRQYYRRLLGLPEACDWVKVDSPFRAEQLSVRVCTGISTRFGDRAASVGPVARLIAEQFESRPGNYFAYVSSFDYLEVIAKAVRGHAPQIEVWMQRRDMPVLSRAAILERFAQPGRGITFAVLGGAFAEGIDLPGERLIGAFIVTLGMPPINPVNSEIEIKMEHIFGKGFEYTYLYPGLQKVVQAAGRVIRTPDDCGTLHLIDHRFSRPEVRNLLPAWWQIQYA